MKIGFVGETNAGKSTLFNRFLGQFRIIVSDVAGTTRENIYDYISWDLKDDIDNSRNNSAIVIDTPGLGKFSDEWSYIKKTIDESDIIVFVVDGKGAITENINKIANYIRKAGKENQTILAVNKLDSVDTTKIELQLSDWYSLGFKHTIGISAKHNYNLYELKELIEKIREKNKIELINKEESKITISFVGRINVGKSTLFNSIIGKDLSKVSSVGGTTLDYLTYTLKINGKKYEIIDTAGFRRKGKIRGLEKIAVNDKLKVLFNKKKPIVVVLFDISEGVTHRDMTILGDLLKKGLPIVVALNKIDDIAPEILKQYKRDLKNGIRFAPWIPIVMISGKEKKGINQLFNMIDLVYENLRISIPTSKLNDIIQKSYLASPPKFSKTKILKIKYITQDKEASNKFIVFVNKKENINFSFKKWLENVIRKNYGFFGVPLKFEFRE